MINRIIIFFLLMLGLNSSAKEIRILVIDSGYSNNIKDLKVCPNGTRDLTGKGMSDRLGHGTVILGIIAENLKDIPYCVYILKIYDDESFETPFIIHLDSFLYAYHIKDLDIINYSSNGTVYSRLEEVIINTIVVEKRVKFVTAAGNHNTDLDKKCNSWPACMDNVISVGSLHRDGKKDSRSNYGKRVTAWEFGYKCVNDTCMRGTSMATAVHTSKIAKKIYEYRNKK